MGVIDGEYWYAASEIISDYGDDYWDEVSVDVIED